MSEFKFKYKKAIPDFDPSYGKYVLGKAARMVRPAINIPLKMALGITTICAIIFSLWCITVGLYRLGWFVGCQLDWFNAAATNDHDYINRVLGPAPWLVGLGTLIVPVISYFLGHAVANVIKEKLTNV